MEKGNGTGNKPGSQKGRRGDERAGRTGRPGTGGAEQNPNSPIALRAAIQL